MSLGCLPGRIRTQGLGLKRREVEPVCTRWVKMASRAYDDPGEDFAVKNHTILLATDFSPSSELARGVASSLAVAGRGRLVVVHVEPGQPTAKLEPYYSSLPDPQVPELARRLVAEVPTNPDVPCEHRLLTGDAADEILRQAAEDEADLIVIGTRGWSRVRKLLLGSVAEAVMQRAPCPVIICTVREGAK
jgi:universal stress protein A